MNNIIAIDGPSGSGKSSVSRKVATILGFKYLDTGIIYRAATWWCINKKIDLSNNTMNSKMIENIKLMQLKQSYDPLIKSIFVNNVNITQEIRKSYISEQVSSIAVNKEIRALFIESHKKIIASYAKSGIVVEGRDITTVVAPHAKVRILLTASQEARIKRRRIQLNSEEVKDLKQEIVERDKKDSQVSAFMQASTGVITIDSSNIKFEETVKAVISLVKR